MPGWQHPARAQLHQQLAVRPAVQRGPVGTTGDLRPRRGGVARPPSHPRVRGGGRKAPGRGPAGALRHQQLVPAPGGHRGRAGQGGCPGGRRRAELGHGRGPARHRWSASVGGRWARHRASVGAVRRHCRRGGAGGRRPGRLRSRLRLRCAGPSDRGDPRRGPADRDERRRDLPHARRSDPRRRVAAGRGGHGQRHRPRGGWQALRGDGRARPGGGGRAGRGLDHDRGPAGDRRRLRPPARHRLRPGALRRDAAGDGGGSAARAGRAPTWPVWSTRC